MVLAIFLQIVKILSFVNFVCNRIDRRPVITETNNPGALIAGLLIKRGHLTMRIILLQTTTARLDEKGSGN